ncbi:BamA/TamA family outer membrane protein [Chitinophaga sp. sic0106]|uniref:BamA/TamA family outer membrane protein n=1 Tax=Chitinophaga sp. sic0106 TaxID=2854785 RepID=UPI001C46DB53|nr:BamA/TamA family outer membrane protein [Chitinophaga sp. sic0106]
MKPGAALIILLVALTAGYHAAAQRDTAHHKKHKVNITGIPIINYNSSYGIILGANGMAFFDMSKKDTISPASSAGIGVGYTQNKSWFGVAFGQLYFQENKWRITAAAGTGNINFQYFEAASDVDEGQFVDYASVSRFAFLKVLRKIYGPFYGGLMAKLQHSETVFDVGYDSTAVVNANGLGVTFLYDTRNNVYTPTKGWKANVSFLGNPEWLGSDSVFNSLRFYINYYHPVTKNAVLAARISGFAGLGDVPFTGQHAVGGKDIRGYTNGKYRGNQVYAAQAEYRWNFYKRWGAVGFFGVAFTEAPSSVMLPGGGVGVRFKAIRSRNINIGVDGALGKDDKGIYFRINEAF